MISFHFCLGTAEARNSLGADLIFVHNKNPVYPSLHALYEEMPEGTAPSQVKNVSHLSLLNISLLLSCLILFISVQGCRE